MSCSTATTVATSPSRASVLVRKKVGDNLSFSANYYEDMISSASIDVKLSASPYKETRKQWSGGVDYLHGKSTYSAGIINSIEPDYKANTAFVSVSQDMFGISPHSRWATGAAGTRSSATSRTPTGTSSMTRPSMSAPTTAATRCRLSQILTRNTIASFNYELLTDQGYLPTRTARSATCPRARAMASPWPTR